MNADRLLALFDTVAVAPDDIGRLRRFVLDLAVRGKLVPQDPAEEPVSDLVRRIAAARRGRVRHVQVRDRSRRMRLDQETPCDIPVGWQWVLFGDIADFSAGRTPARKEADYWNTGDHPWVSIADMKEGQTVHTTKETVSESARLAVFKCDPQPEGTILMSFKLTIGKIARLGLPAYHNEAIVSVRPYLTELDPFLFQLLPVLARRADARGAMKGATLNRTSLFNIMVPLPPLAEQHRIVAKVGELMVLCDRLEAAREARETTRRRLTTATYARLFANDDESRAFHASARFTVRVLPALTARSDQIKSLRKTILDLAVRGRLVPQDPADEPASELLERMATEKARMVREGAIRKPRMQSHGGDLRPFFNVPQDWLWCRLSSVGAIVGGSTPRASDPGNFEQPGQGIPWLTPADLGAQGTLYIARGRRDLSELGLRSCGATLMPAGTVLFSSRAPIGYVAIAANPVSTNQGFKSIVPFVADCSRFIALVMEALVPAIDAAASGTTFKEVPGKMVSALPFPLPPFAEQRRIVAKVDEIMALCDRLQGDSKPLAQRGGSFSTRYFTRHCQRPDLSSLLATPGTAAEAKTASRTKGLRPGAPRGRHPGRGPGRARRRPGAPSRRLADPGPLPHPRTRQRRAPFVARRGDGAGRASRAGRGPVARLPGGARGGGGGGAARGAAARPGHHSLPPLTRPRPCGPLCRLKPAFQAGGAMPPISAMRSARLRAVCRPEKPAYSGTSVSVHSVGPARKGVARPSSQSRWPER